MTASKQAICVSKAISAQPSSPYPYLSVCLSIWSPPRSLGVGANEGAGGWTKGRAEQENWLCRGLGSRWRRWDRKEKWGCMDTADMAVVVFHSDLSGSSENINSGFYLSDVLKQPAFKSSVWSLLRGEVGLHSESHSFNIKAIVVVGSWRNVSPATLAGWTNSTGGFTQWLHWLQDSQLKSGVHSKPSRTNRARGQATSKLTHTDNFFSTFLKFYWLAWLTTIGWQSLNEHCEWLILKYPLALREIGIRGATITGNNHADELENTF